MEKKSFEVSILELENSVKRLESGELTLDEAISEFERAMGLVKVCNERLEDAEMRVRILTEGMDGEITDRPFDTSDEA